MQALPGGDRVPIVPIVRAERILPGKIILPPAPATAVARRTPETPVMAVARGGPWKNATSATAIFIDAASGASIREAPLDRFSADRFSHRGLVRIQDEFKPAGEGDSSPLQAIPRNRASSSAQAVVPAHTGAIPRDHPSGSSLGTQSKEGAHT